MQIIDNRVLIIPVFINIGQGKAMLKRIIRFIYPATCILCGQQGSANRDLCAACAADIVCNEHACRCCAIPLPVGADQQLCGQCLQKKPVYDYAWSPFLYAQPLEWIIQQIKFNSRLSYTAVLAELLIEHMPELKDRPDCLMPVPLHDRRMRQRGFNQSLELSRAVAEKLKIPLEITQCRRTKYSGSQTGMDAKQRRRNVKGIFEFNNTKNYKHVVIFDDVVTTGSTVTELSRVLKREGVKRVGIWSLARAEKALLKK